MNIKEIRELLKLIEQSPIEEFEMEKSGVRIRIKKTGAGSQSKPPPSLEPTSEVSRQPTADRVRPSEEEKGPNLYLFKAPLVGTFYTVAKPDAEPFVRMGDRVNKGTIVCAIEAMKLFNQVECDVEGEIVKVLVENGQPVEYGEPLFEIRLMP